MDNEFNYELQVWTTGDIVQECAHPESMKENNCCNAYVYRWMDIECALRRHKNKNLFKVHYEKEEV